MTDQEESKEIVEKKDESLAEQLTKTVSLLKKKVSDLQERNKALLTQCKAQAIKLKEQSAALVKKPIDMSKSFYDRVRSLFNREHKTRHYIFIFNGQTLALTGIELGRKQGWIKVHGIISKYDLINNAVEETIMQLKDYEIRASEVTLVV